MRKFFKNWPTGWFLSPDMKIHRKKIFNLLFDKIAILLLLVVMVVVGFLSVQFFANLKNIKTEISTVDESNFEEILFNFQQEIEKISADENFFDGDESLISAIKILIEKREIIFKEITEMKIFLYGFPKVLQDKSSITDFLNQLFSKIEVLDSNLDEVANILNSHNALISYNKNLEKYIDYFADATVMFDNIMKHKDAILSLLGDRYPRRYMLLLQNNYEIRPTGGFIGGYVIFDVDEGYIQNLNYLDVYQLDGQITNVDTSKIPEEIRQIAGEMWGVRDANISPDFAVSSRFIQMLFEKAKGDSVDPILAIDLHFVAQLFDFVGELKLPSYNLTLNKDNFETVLMYLVESKSLSTEDPKVIFKDLVPAFLDALKVSNLDFAKISKMIYKLVNEKHIQAFSGNEDVQNFFRDFGLAEEISPKPFEDFLQVIQISIGGNKTDKWINEKYLHRTFIANDGQITNELTINRINEMSEELLSTQKEILKQAGFVTIDPVTEKILFTGVNRNRFRIYVPFGSELVLSEGVNISDIDMKFDQDIGLNYFSFETMLEMDTSQKITIVYKLPFTMDDVDVYRMQLLKQSGKDYTEITKQIIAEGELMPKDFYPDFFVQEKPGTYTYRGLMNQDINFGTVVSK